MTTEYAGKLSKILVNNKVYSTQAIYNKEGAILVAEHQELTPALLMKIKRHLLDQPLESSVKLQSSLAKEDLYHDILTLLKKLPSMWELHTNFIAKHNLHHACAYYSQIPTLVQLLTVFSLLYPKRYKRALLLAWGGWLIASAGGENHARCNVIFCANLFHEIGVLYLNDDIEQVEQVASDDDETRKRTLVSAKAVSRIPGIPDALFKAIEGVGLHPTSTGFMSSVALHKVSTDDQIIWLSHFLYDVINDRFAFRVDINDVLPLLRLYFARYFPVYFKVAITLIENADMPNRVKTEVQLLSCVRALLMNYILLVRMVELYSPVRDILLSFSANKVPAMVLQKIEQIEFILSSTGILSEPLMRWMSHVEEDQLLSAAEEIREYYILQQELARQLNRFVLLVRRFTITNHSKLQGLLNALEVEFDGLVNQLNYLMDEHH